MRLGTNKDLTVNDVFSEWTPGYWSKNLYLVVRVTHNEIFVRDLLPHTNLFDPDGDTKIVLLDEHESNWRSFEGTTKQIAIYSYEDCLAMSAIFSRAAIEALKNF